MKKKATNPQASSSKKDEARDLLIRVKLYRFVALLFAITGVGIFAYMYHHNAGNSVIDKLTNPLIAVFLAVPFLPAIVFSFKAKKLEDKLFTIIGTLKE